MLELARAVHSSRFAREVAKRTREEMDRIPAGRIDARTDHGVRLGMSKSEVIGLVGKPGKTMWSTKFQADEIIYYRAGPKDAEGVWTRYSNYYLFRKGKLYYIELARDAIGGA